MLSPFPPTFRPQNIGLEHSNFSKKSYRRELDQDLAKNRAPTEPTDRLVKSLPSRPERFNSEAIPHCPSE